ncbi:hypothetical protein FNF27_08155 [Cafeteria roenbergensis]|uniref:tryptophan synthase n=1 Tax=Cafeteria roenbergensis TaxID=33653 RepID=A0A5A8C5J2_CAFRO|nr:hypothetical protein FNF29_08181 [Cafeteria roenbergensis]KAA0148293.1 hypothetical protein FNF31_07436 [Cafeteria roenbergensis]KAA0161533.1 hypothetical protein FNF27_08155 [Cafeteria roenbergensis]CAE7441136.1 trp-3 [Symbiodinium sp. KB8]|eukprot:KAA0146232.1 hypothetical protein FNF29_08181 [Cafeteria roenbergensis]
MSEAIAAAFAKCKEEGRVAFVPFITAGYPTLESTPDILLAMEAAGSDIIEVGMPFSDPLADGGTIQAANTVALRAGVTMDKCLSFVEAARARGLKVPVILMTYYNPILRFGEERLVARCKECGVHGFIVVDLPPEEGSGLLDACKASGLALVPLVAPTTTPARLDAIAKNAGGYVYCVSVTGVTGARAELPADLAEFVARVKAAIPLPAVVGFGLSTRAHVASVGAVAEGAVMGSAIVRAAAAGGADAVSALIKEVTGRSD